MSQNTDIEYTLTGSGAGIRASKVANSTAVDFAGSDSPLLEVDYSEGAEVGLKVRLDVCRPNVFQSFPFVSGSIVMAYNLPGAPAQADHNTLVLSREAIVGVFNGMSSLHQGLTKQEPSAIGMTRSLSMHKNQRRPVRWVGALF